MYTHIHRYTYTLACFGSTGSPRLLDLVPGISTRGRRSVELVPPAPVRGQGGMVCPSSGLGQMAASSIRTHEQPDTTTM